MDPALPNLRYGICSWALAWVYVVKGHQGCVWDEGVRRMGLFPATKAVTGGWLSGWGVTTAVVVHKETVGMG